MGHWAGVDVEEILQISVVSCEISELTEIDILTLDVTFHGFFGRSCEPITMSCGDRTRSWKPRTKAQWDGRKTGRETIQNYTKLIT